MLLVVLDDVGFDKIGAYGHGWPTPATPTLDRLIAEGRFFRHAWSQPMCSPTRATLMTGRLAQRTGVGQIVFSWEEEVGLPDDERTLPEMLRRSPVRWDTSFVGKWHLDGQPDAAHGPGRQGFAWYRGTLGNLREPIHSGEEQAPDLGYAHWIEDDNGELHDQRGWVVERTADDTIARMAAMEEPWLLWSAFHAAHVPFDPVPPGIPGAEVASDAPLADRHEALVRAADHELGRILDAMSPALRARTTVIVVGDNGTPMQAIRPPLPQAQGKGSVYELGVRVPLVVTGPLVDGPGPTDALVHTVDVFATIAALAGVDPGLDRTIDGVSLLPVLRDPGARVRATVTTDVFVPNHGARADALFDAIRDERFKL
ncbi:MAG: sulfatase-like hydrolase/transferase, partial [Myxococcales bacterium]|nr:sulfatase-like hydrolase/transferase [Myxococcales bacterium]